MLTNTIRQSLAAKITALSFIVMILLANFWLIYVITDTPGPEWIKVGFAFSMLGAFIGGFWLLVLQLKVKEIPIDDSDEEEK